MKRQRSCTLNTIWSLLLLKRIHFRNHNCTIDPFLEKFPHHLLQPRHTKLVSLLKDWGIDVNQFSSRYSDLGCSMWFCCHEHETKKQQKTSSETNWKNSQFFRSQMNSSGVFLKVCCLCCLEIPDLFQVDLLRLATNQLDDSQDAPDTSGSPVIQVKRSFHSSWSVDAWITAGSGTWKPDPTVFRTNLKHESDSGFCLEIDACFLSVLYWGFVFNLVFFPYSKVWQGKEAVKSMTLTAYSFRPFVHMSFFSIVTRCLNFEKLPMESKNLGTYAS